MSVFEKKGMAAAWELHTEQDYLLEVDILFTVLVNSDVMTVMPRHVDKEIITLDVPDVCERPSASMSTIRESDSRKFSSPNFVEVLYKIQQLCCVVSTSRASKLHRQYAEHNLHSTVVARRDRQAKLTEEK